MVGSRLCHSVCAQSEQPAHGWMPNPMKKRARQRTEFEYCASFAGGKWTLRLNGKERPIERECHSLTFSWRREQTLPRVLFQKRRPPRRPQTTVVSNKEQRASIQASSSSLWKCSTIRTNRKKEASGWYIHSTLLKSCYWGGFQEDWQSGFDIRPTIGL